MKAKKKRLIITGIITVIIIITISLVTISLMQFNRYKTISEMQEPTILFVRTAREWQSEGEYRIKALDNQGNIYYLYTNRSLEKVLNEGLLTEEHIVSKIPADEIETYYDMVCDMKMENAYKRIDGDYIPEATDYYYYGIRYHNEEFDLIEVYNTYGRINESEHAEEVLEWMYTWQWLDDRE